MGRPTTTQDTVRNVSEHSLPSWVLSHLALIMRGAGRRWRPGIERREELMFYLLISPWIIGFVVFIAGPMLSSLYLSLTEWDLLQPPQWAMLDNYVTMLFRDPLFWHSLKVTLFYTVGTVLLGTTGSLLLASLLNQSIRGVSVYRAVYYLPSVISGVAVAHLWRMVLNPEFGLLNLGLGFLGIQGPGWLADPQWALPSLILISLWGLGGGMIIFLAGLQAVPRQLYEAAEIDGAGRWACFWNVTLPMLSPIILFSLIVNTIDSFQVFTQVYVLTGGGPANATNVYALYLYQNAFRFFKMGYASAMAWGLFFMILAVTVLQLKVAPRWVHYEAE